MPHEASERAEVQIVAYRGYDGSVVHCVRYIVLPSGENEQAPSSNSELSSVSMASGFCHLPFSSFVATKMSPFIMPVMPLSSSPLASVRVEVK